MSFVNKVAIVTGASSGIGAAIAVKFAAEGAKVTIVGRNEKKLKTVADKCEQTGGRPLTIVADIAKSDNAIIVNDTISQFGRLDVLVNNAGIGHVTGILAKNALQIYDEVMNTNLRSVVSLTNLAGPHLVNSKGNIVNISSIASLRAFKNLGFAYSTSKAGLDHFTRIVAAELASKGVRANIVNPGPVDTDIFSNIGMNDEQVAVFKEALKKSTALGRISASEEIADVVLFLASDKAKAITGASFVVDNGSLVRS